MRVALVRRTFSSTKTEPIGQSTRELLISFWTRFLISTTSTGSFRYSERDATLCRVGVGKLTTANQYGQMTTVLNRADLAGSNTGGIRETQDMLDFCAIQNIKPQITKIPMDGINDAWSKVIAKEARYRFVMDMGVKA